jgi:glycosyltransferase involved in cell wall biosynthesis
MGQVRIDVFIPVYNDVRFLPHAVNSVLSQTEVDVRVIVSDNASTDGTYEWISEQATKDPRIKLTRNPTNLGHSANIKKYKDLVEAPYYMFLCSDDMLLSPDAFKKASDIMENDSSAVSIFSDMEYIDKNNKVVMSRRFRRSGQFSGEAVLRQSLVTLRNMFGIPLLNRTTVHSQIPFPDQYPYAGDVMMAAYAARQGSVYHIPETLIGNRYTGGNLTSSLLWNSLPEFRRMEREMNVNLGVWEHMRQRINAPLVALSKAAFLSWIRYRSRKI